MAPRTGIRGVTIPDVEAVGANGRSAMRGGYTFTRPGTTPAPAFDVQNLIRGLTATPLNTAGEKYSGFPTASAQEAAVLGSIVPFYAIGDYAAKLAAAEDARLRDESMSQLRLGEGTAASRALGAIRSALSGDTAESRGVASAQDALAQVLAENAMYEQARSAIRTAGQTSDKPEFFAPSVRGESTEGQREEARMARAAMPEESGLMARTAQEMLARKALRDAAYADAMARRNAVALAGTTQQIVIDPMTGEQRLGMATLPQQTTPIRMRDVAVSQATPGVQQQYEADVEQLVAPMEQLAAGIAEVPRYQLAQQMATQYFGMDPALAAGTFTPAIDVDYMQAQRELRTEQDLARGVDPTATIADTLLRNDPTGASLQEYQDALAIEAQRKLTEGQNTLAEDEFDANLEMATGISIDTAAGDFSRSTARYFLSNPEFMSAVQASIADMQTAELPLGLEPKDRVAQIANDYANQYKDPIGAVILANILASFSPIIPTGG